MAEPACGEDTKNSGFFVFYDALCVSSSYAFSEGMFHFGSRILKGIRQKGVYCLFSGASGIIPFFCPVSVCKAEMGDAAGFCRDRSLPGMLCGAAG